MLQKGESVTLNKKLFSARQETMHQFQMEGFS